MSRRVGILGGTFDPIHRGHLDLAEAAQAALSLTSILVVPSHVPPHRRLPAASSFHRFAMVSLAVSGRTGWQASDIELAAGTRSYTSATLRGLRDRGYAASELFFLIGADAFADITKWKDYPQLLDLASFAVVSRPGFRISQLRHALPEVRQRMVDAAEVGTNAGKTSIILIDAQTADVSSTDIRHRRAKGLSIAGMVAPGVQQHIEQHGLYASTLPDRREFDELAKPAAGRLHGQS